MTKTSPLTKSLVPAVFFALFSPLLLAQPAGYYDGVDTSSPEALRQSLHAIIDDHQRFPYTSSATDTWDVLEMADELQGNPGRIITLYSNAAFDKQGGGNNFYNREHVWPKSYGFPDNDSSINYPFTDMHSLFLSDVDYNFARSNHPFKYCDANCVEYVTQPNDGRGGAGGGLAGAGQCGFVRINQLIQVANLPHQRVFGTPSARNAFSLSL